jgi:uncharacterized protein (TIGR02421 family)
VSPEEIERIRTVAGVLHQAAKPLKVLGAIAWPMQVRHDFLESDGQRLPEVTYEPFDPAETLGLVAEARRSIYPGEMIDDWLEGVATDVESTARLLATRGTEAFRAHGRNLYGDPTTPLRYDPATPLDLARRVLDVIDGLARFDGVFADPGRASADEVAEHIERAVARHFGDDAPRVEVVDELSANALASPSRIRIRRGANFTDRDAQQLLEHEAYIHVGTSLNGRYQDALPLLGVSHPGTTRTQEGIAVWAELMSGTLDLDRFRRLADRVVAIQMALDGADFIEVYRWFRDKGIDDGQAYESTRRVFRGGVVTGGVPFLKDVVYLAGLLEVATFVKAAFAAGRLDCIRLLFVGKVDLADIPALGALANAGLVEPARYVPPWVRDPRAVLASLTWSVFSSGIDFDRVTMSVERMLGRTPSVEFATAPPTS